MSIATGSTRIGADRRTRADSRGVLLQASEAPPLGEGSDRLTPLQGGGLMPAFRLADGTIAGIVPTRGLRHLTVEQLGLPCLVPARAAAVVFYVPDSAALDRIRTRFGLGVC